MVDDNRMHTIGSTIASLRKAKGWTQLELAQKLCVSDKTVSKWENDYGAPSVEFYPRLSELFGVSIDSIMTGEQPEQRRAVDKTADSTPADSESAPAQMPSVCKPLVIAYYIIVALSVFAPIFVVIGWLPFFPSNIPAHYDLSGVVDRMGSRYELLMLPPSNIILFVVISFALRYARRRGQAKETAALMITASVVYLSMTAMTFYFCARAYITSVDAYGRAEPNLFRLASLYSSMAIFAVGAAMPFSKPNMLFGIRTRRTMSSPAVWKKSNLLGGCALMLCAAAEIVVGLVCADGYINIIVFTVAAAVGIVACFVAPIVAGKISGKEKIRNI